MRRKAVPARTATAIYIPAPVVKTSTTRIVELGHKGRTWTAR